VGRKINVKNERKVQKLYRLYLAAIVIQKCWRMHQGKRRLYQIKVDILVTYLQKHVRTFLAKCLKSRLVLQNAAATVV
jgi:hypothetical protein